MTSAGIPGGDVHRVSTGGGKNYPGVHGRTEVAKDVDVVNVDYVTRYFQVTIRRSCEVCGGSNVGAAVCRQLWGLQGHTCYGRVGRHTEADANGEYKNEVEG